VVTKLVPNFGKSFLMNTELTQPEPTTEIPISNLKESTSITTKQLVADMSQELFLWT
jgi:hypothetical protein